MLSLQLVLCCIFPKLSKTIIIIELQRMMSQVLAVQTCIFSEHLSAEHQGSQLAVMKHHYT